MVTATTDGGAPDGDEAAPAPQRAGSPRRVRWPPTVSAVVGSVAALVGYTIGLRPFTDNSFFTHLATGRLMLERGALVTADPYSFTAAGEPWVVQSWLPSLLYAWVESWTGAAGIRLLTGVVAGTIAALVWTLSRPAGALLVRVGLVSLVLAAALVMWSPRPFLVGLLLLCLVLLAAEGRLDPRWLLLVMWVWVNSHGSFPLGLVAVALLALGRRLDHGDARTEVRALRWALGGTLLGVVSPVGPRILTFPVALLGRSETLQQVVEWRSPDFSQFYARVFLVEVVVGVALIARRPSWRAVLPFVAFTGAALLGLRNIPVAGIVFVPVLAHCARGIRGVQGRERSGVWAVVGLAVALVAGVVTVTSLQRPPYLLSDFAVDAVAWLDQHDAVARPGVEMAEHDPNGNYLELLYGDRARVFSDDRVDMFPKAVIDDQVALLNGRPDWEAVLRDRGVDVVLWDRRKPLAQLLAGSPDWRTVYQDPTWMVACRRGSGVAGC